MSDFAQQLTELRGIDPPLIDRTDILGVYDITFKSAASAMLDPAGPRLLTPIQEQLVKLVPAKDLIELVVVDRAKERSVTDGHVLRRHRSVRFRSRNDENERTALVFRITLE